MERQGESLLLTKGPRLKMLSRRGVSHLGHLKVSRKKKAHKPIMRESRRRVVMSKTFRSQLLTVRSTMTKKKMALKELLSLKEAP